jgi:hypothetical protein
MAVAVTPEASMGGDGWVLTIGADVPPGVGKGRGLAPVEAHAVASIARHAAARTRQPFIADTGSEAACSLYRDANHQFFNVFTASLS